MIPNDYPALKLGIYLEILYSHPEPVDVGTLVNTTRATPEQVEQAQVALVAQGLVKRNNGKASLQIPTTRRP